RESHHCARWENSPDADRQIVQRHGFRSALFIPLVFHGESLGVVEVFSARDSFESPEGAIRSLKLAAGQLAAVLRNAREMELRRQLLEERTRALDALHETEARFRSL